MTDPKKHGNMGNRNAAKPPEQHVSGAPTINLRGVPRRGLYAKAASARKMKLRQWMIEAAEEKLARETEGA